MLSQIPQNQLPWINWELNNTATLYYFFKRTQSIGTSKAKNWFVDNFKQLLNTQLQQPNAQIVNLYDLQTIFKRTDDHNYVLELARFVNDIKLAEHLKNTKLLIGGLFHGKYTKLEAESILTFQQLTVKYALLI